MKAMVVINPISGTRNKKQTAHQVVSSLVDAGWSVTEEWTTGPGVASELTHRAVDEEYDGVVAIGGDGTINECAKALLGSRTALGIIPCGSGNGLARHLGISMNIDKAIRTITDGFILDCDYGTAGDLPFMCTFGIGFDALVSEKFASKGKRGLMTYVNTALHEFTHYKPATYTIQANGEVITDKAFLVTVCNASQYGNNVYCAPGASVIDGLLDVTIVHYDNMLTNALVGLDMLTGMVGDNMFCHTLRTESVTIIRDQEGPAHIDGEPLHLGREVVCRCHPGGVRMFVPLYQEQFTPIATPFFSLLRDLKTRIVGK